MAPRTRAPALAWSGEAADGVLGDPADWVADFVEVNLRWAVALSLAAAAFVVVFFFVFAVLFLIFFVVFGFFVVFLFFLFLEVFLAPGDLRRGGIGDGAGVDDNALAPDGFEVGVAEVERGGLQGVEEEAGDPGLEPVRTG
jgi:hypothetical protein